MTPKTYVELVRKSILAGILIGMAAMFSMSVAEYGPLVQGLCFSVGLFGIVASNAALFTGRMLAWGHVLDKDVTVGYMLTEWAEVLAFNLTGIAITCALANGIGFDASAIAVAKASMPWGEILVRAFFCNIMVCLAVNCGRWATSVADWFFACLMPVACFVTCGFEHSIADMFYMFLGLRNGAVDIWSALYVISLAVIGNVLGGSTYALLSYERRKQNA